jgi:outer membrane protein TolC/ABC-type uncharacterized transport system substrate-binding protein
MLKRWPLALLAVFGVPCAGLSAQAPARVALILDRESPRFAPMVAAFQQELETFFHSGQLELLPPRSGDGTIAGTARVLNAALEDPTVSVVVTLGSISSHILASGGRPPKPAIAATIVDGTWQNLPHQDDASGVHNLAYVDQSYPVGSTLVDFHRLIPFRKLAVLFDDYALKGIPQLEAGVAALVRVVGAEAVIVSAREQAQATLDAIPADADAVYLTPMATLSADELNRLIAGLNARRLPTLSYSADPEVTLGALASYEPAANWQRRARRVAVDLQRILAGEDAGSLPVRLVSAPRLTINLATARAIGFSPGWSVLTDAELVGVDSAGPADTLSLAQAMRGAAQTNLDLAAADLSVFSGHQDVLLARANLFPQVDSRLTQTYTRTETAAASLGQQPERKLDGGVSFSMPLYSEQAWAGFSAQQRLQGGREAERDQVRLDVVLDAAIAYLNVLRAQTLVGVQRSNLDRTRSNLEVARLRESIGTSSRADIYRWQGEVANARRELIDAESQVRVASLELKRILNRPLDLPLGQRPVSLSDPALLVQDSTMLAWFDSPVRFRQLTSFLVQEALRISPELVRSEAAISAQRRQRTAAGRAFWLPDLALQGGLTNEFSRGGAGAGGISLPQPSLLPQAEDLSWQVKLQASFPIFTGFAHTAARSQTGFELDRLEIQRDATRQLVDQRVRATLENAGAGYAAIALTRDAAEASARNYELVSDAYASGSVSITTLLDAQSAAVNAAEAAANAVNDFLIDLMNVERAMGSFGALQSPEQRSQFLERLQSFVRSQP